jgi:ATP-dependent helicase/nuclease subunit A
MATNNNIKIISAGAGSGKTYRLTQEMVALLRGGTRASGIIATTFTAKAAAELQERVRTKLLEEGLTDQANDLSNALIGTVHGLGVKLLRRFAFEAGVSPKVDIIAEEDSQIFFNQSLSQILTFERVEQMNELCDRLGMTKKGGSYDWRKDIRQLVDVARANAFDKAILEKSKQLSFDTFKTFLGIPLSINEDFNKILLEKIEQTIDTLDGCGDETKVTGDAIGDLKTLRNEMRQRESLHWHQWVKLTKLKVSAKSRDYVEDLIDYANKHLQFPDFQNDIQSFIYHLFDIVIEAIAEYDRFKKQRGLIDYTDMEVSVRHLLADPSVISVLKEELDLLMVDEFQDTSPIQLDIFLKLSKIAKHSIWVGDPKQSIYGFRGAEPRLMHAIIAHIGINDADILKDSWRSRPDIVATTNAIFTKAFDDLPVEQVALNARRMDNNLQTDALIHWHFIFDTGGDTRKKQPGSPWVENCLADSIKVFLERENFILPKGEKSVRAAQAGDIAILCRTNDQCKAMAEALHRVGLKAAISRTGLLETAEAKLITAVLRYLLNKHDSLSVAEILLLAEKEHLSAIIENRLDFLAQVGEDNYDWRWGHDNAFIKKINDLRKDISELSANEILNLILEELDLRRIIATWGNTTQRLDNVDIIRHFSLQYEEACNRLHSAASLGGFLLWLGNLADREDDKQSSGEGPEAVNVLTYHRSKGLEYPIVVMGNLEQNMRDSVFGISLESDNTEGPVQVNLDNILSGRWLRYWVNPYADQLRHTELEEKINASPAKAKATEAALAEEARLLYVGITRARDYLIFYTSQNPTKWLNRTWHKGKEEFPTLEAGNETPFQWAEKWLSKDYEEFYYEKDFGYVTTHNENIFFIENRDSKENYLPYRIEPEKEGLPYNITANIGATLSYASPLILKEDAQPNLVAKAFEALIMAAAEDNDAYNFSLSKKIIDRYNIADIVDNQILTKQVLTLYDFFNKTFSPQNILKNYPLRTHDKERLFEQKIPILIEKKISHTEGPRSEGSGYILIAQNDFAGDIKKMRQEASKQFVLLYYAQKALKKISKTQDIQCFVHFYMQGSLVEVVF